MAGKNRNNRPRLELLAEFEAAPSSTLLPQSYLAAICNCSESTIARDRGLGRGCPYIRIGKRVLYCKLDILKWLEQHRPGLSDAPASAASGERHKPIQSTAEADAQASQLREAALNVAVAARSREV
jgi:hypothetical protein